MTDLSSLSDADLNERVCRVLGWKKSLYGSSWILKTGARIRTTNKLPNYLADLERMMVDALAAKICTTTGTDAAGTCHGHAMRADAGVKSATHPTSPTRALALAIAQLKG